MSQKVISTEEEVKKFLIELKGSLADPNFNVDTDLDVLLKKSLNLRLITTPLQTLCWHLILISMMFVIN